jgi:selenocysteine-specific elongation factor
LYAGDFVRVGAAIRRATHRPALPAQLQAAGAKLRSTLAAKPFDPPSRKELAPDPVSQQALRFLIATGEAVEINMEVLMAAENVRRATELIRQFIRDHGPATVSELRQTLGSSRRVIVPLLERLDRDGVTLRQDDKRALSKMSKN